MRSPEPTRTKTKSRRRPATPKLNRLHKPDNLSLEEWQILLRQQFGREQKFRLKNVGGRPAFSEFLVANPQSKNTYRVTIRGRRPGENSCTCPDFATNTLGTCKHVEFVLARLERNRTAARELNLGYRPIVSEVYLRHGALREVCFCPAAKAPPKLAQLTAEYFTPEGLLRPEGAAGFDVFLAAAAEIDPALKCGDDVLAFLAELRDVEFRTRRVAEAFPRGIRSAAFKNLLRVPLYDYQRDGALFAVRSGRCLIGDEMGLGKTVQALAAAEIMAKLYGVERVLIVCPTSLKHQWRSEIERFTGRPTRVVEGLKPRRIEAFADPAPFFKITNYDTVHADIELIDGWGPDLVILDEAQRIKNWSTRVARSVKRIQSPYAIVLTGTPLENRLEELISIVQFVDQHRLGPTFRLLDQHQVRDEVGKVTGYRGLDKIGQTLAPVLLRRQKDQVLDQLPERIESTIFVPMTEYQRQLHTENQEIVARIVAKWRRYRFLSEADKQRLMAALQRMRMSCDSSYLVDPKTDAGVKAGEAATLLGELLERPGTKAVVFSQWLRMHDLLAREAREREWGHVLFHGGVPGPKRKDLIERFRTDPNCKIFFSTDAGGVGLNLQFASVVLNMDLPWNPAVLEQRIGRVHRLGQRRAVRVVKFVAKGTIEEGMLEVLRFKKSLFAGVLDGGETEVNMGGSRMKKFMETVQAATACIPAVVAAEAEEAAEASREFTGEPAPTDDFEACPEVAADPWSALLQAGTALVHQWASPRTGDVSAAVGSLLRKDESTGETYLRLPAPSNETIEQALKAVQGLLAQIGSGRS